MNRPKNDPQDFETMMTTAEGKRSARIYKQENGEYIDGEISRLVQMSTEELARIADGIGVVRLEDTQAVKVKSVEYLRACSEASTLPAIGGFCRSLGYSVEGVRQFRMKHPTHPTTQYIELFRDLCSDVLSDAALRNLTNSVYSIFYQKARNGLEDKITLEAVQQQGPLGEVPDPEEIARRYQALGLLDDD